MNQKTRLLPALREAACHEHRAPGAMVLIIDGMPSGRMIQHVDGPRLTVGRSRESDIVLRDPSVSRQHIQLDVTPTGMRVQRCPEAAPVFVNDREVESATLAASDILRLGSCRLRLDDCAESWPQRDAGGDDVFTLRSPPAMEVRAGTQRPFAGDAFVARDCSDDATLVPLEQEAEPDDGSGFLGATPASERLKNQIKRVAATDATVLLVGESGTGKSLVARLLHQASKRTREPFYVINCAAIPEQLIESELFGHMKGAFTGAIGARTGIFEAAASGTIFLDEIAELPLTSQAKLLRVLEERSFQRVGSNRAQEMKARIIAATNRDLKQMVEEGSLRADLYYRLSVVQLSVPALRDRNQDVLRLADHLLREISQRHDRRFTGFAREASAAISGYAWPGNVRELRNMIESAVVLGEGPVVTLADLPGLPCARGVEAQRQEDGAEVVRLPIDLASLETKAIEAALRATSGNRTRAASLLGINRVTLYKKLRQPASGELHDFDRAVAEED